MSGGSIGTVVGGLVGFLTGIPGAVAIGATIGGAVGQAIDPPKIPNAEGPRLKNKGVTNAKYGGQVPRNYGRHAINYAQMIWAEGNELTEIRRETEVGGGGKGGGSSQTQITYEYRMTAAFLVGTGLIDRYGKIWVGPYLVYDGDYPDFPEGSTDLADYFSRIAGNDATWDGGTITLYTGTADQDPDPRIEADVGVENASAYRGEHYIVFKDWPMEKFANNPALFQVKAEIIQPPDQIERFDIALNTALGLVNEGTAFETYSRRIGCAYSGDGYISVWSSNFDDTSDDASIVPTLSYGRLGGSFGTYGYEEIKSIPHPLWDEMDSGTNSSGYTTLFSCLGRTNVDCQLVFVPRSDSKAWIALAYPDGTVKKTSGESEVDMLGAQMWAVIDEHLFILDATTHDGSGAGIHLYIRKYNISGDNIVPGDVVFYTGPDSLQLSNSRVYRVIKCGVTDGKLMIWLHWLNQEGAGVASSSLRFVEYDPDTLLVTLDEDSVAAGLNPANGSNENVPHPYYPDFLPNGVVVMAVTADTGEGNPEDVQINFATSVENALDQNWFEQPEYFDENWPNYNSTFGFPGNDQAYYNIFKINGEYAAVCLNSHLGDELRAVFTSGQTNLTYLDEIVEAECLQSKYLTSADIDVTELADIPVRGFTANAIAPIRASLNALQFIHPFDFIIENYKITFKTRGRASEATIPYTKLGKDVQWRAAKEMDSKLPKKVIISGADPSRNYEENSQFYEIEHAECVGVETHQLPIAGTSEELQQFAEVSAEMRWLERYDIGPLLLEPEYYYLRPTSVVTVTRQNSTHEIRIVNKKQNPDGWIEILAKPNNAAIYTATVTGEAPSVSSDNDIEIPTVATGLILDIPVISPEIQNTPGIVDGAYAEADWQGGGVYRSVDGVTYTQIGSLAEEANAAVCTGSEVLPEVGGSMIYLGATLTVTFMNDYTPSSVTELAMMNGANLCAYGNQDRWEIIAFQNATLISGSSYTLDTFLRGLYGTEWATGTHQQGDYLVMLSIGLNLGFSALPATAIGADSDIVITSNFFAFDSFPVIDFTYTAENLRPLSPVQPTVTYDSDITIEFVRRGRVYAGWRDSVEVPLGEANELYYGDVYSSGGTLMRTIQSSTEQIIYTAADQTTDFGAPLSEGVGHYIDISQISEIAGRGRALRVYL